MQVKLLKDWAGFKKTDLIEITDEAVLSKGFEIGLFEKQEDKKVKPKKEE
jgi:hypothetical protein